MISAEPGVNYLFTTEKNFYQVVTKKMKRKDHRSQNRPFGFPGRYMLSANVEIGVPRKYDTRQ
jgi:hypothetical protein